MEFKTMKVENLCPFCRKPNTVEVDAEGFRRWQKGEHVQDVFPNLSDNEREALISGSHGDCWDKAFAEEEEGGEPCVACDSTGHDQNNDGQLCRRCGGTGSV
jgi:hypothetical protein